MTEEYYAKLREAQEFQDFITLKLNKEIGINIGCFGSFKYQTEVGESVSGFEIKHDKMFRKTGNIYIETHEKTDSDNKEYVPSGILRKDNTWMWCIGDYDDVFLIPKMSLVRLYTEHVLPGNEFCSRYGIKRKGNYTSAGFVIPIEYAKSYIVAKHIKFKE